MSYMFVNEPLKQVRFRKHLSHHLKTPNVFVEPSTWYFWLQPYLLVSSPLYCLCASVAVASSCNKSLTNSWTFVLFILVWKAWVLIKLFHFYAALFIGSITEVLHDKVVFPFTMTKHLCSGTLRWEFFSSYFGSISLHCISIYILGKNCVALYLFDCSQRSH